MTLAVLTALLLAVSPQQKPSEAAAPPKTPEAEVRTADGSTVRLTVLEESLEILTTYGKLTVPMRDVRRVELGLHVPDGVEQRVQAAVRRLGSTAHREREDAVAELVALGEYAYQAVHAAQKAKDLEVAERAGQVLARLKELVPADRLRLDGRDRVHTADMVIVGTIATPTVRGRTAHFGEVELPLASLRDYRQLGGGGGTEIVVDAAKYGGPVAAWLDTALDVLDGQPLTLTASGQVDLWPPTPGQYLTGPGGYRNAGTLNGNWYAGTLIGRIGTGEPFLVGEKHTLAAPRHASSGRLFLSITASPWNGPSAGGYVVKMAR